MTFPKRYADLVARLRVPSGFLLVGAFAWFSAPDSGSLAGGLPVSIAGLGLRAWAAGHLAKNQQLAVGGPYAYVRNPLYVGTLLVALGLVIAAKSVGLAMLFVAVFIFVYLPVVELEGQHLRDLFPEYREYARHVPAFIPRLTASPRARHTFQLALYLRNQEYQALAGFLAGTAVLVWKAWK